MDLAEPVDGAPGAPGAPGAIRRSGRLSGLLLTAVAVGLLLFLIGWAAPVLAPLGLGLFLTALAAPFFGWLTSRGAAPIAAITITVAVVLLIGGALVVLALVSTTALTDSLAGYSASLEARYADLAAAGVPPLVQEVIGPAVLTGLLRRVVELILELGPQVVFGVFITALLLLDGPRLVRLEARGLGERNPVLREAPAIARSAVTYFRVRIRINAVTALGLLVIMLVVGVDHALLWAVGAFFLSFVPYLGLILALIPPTILAFAETGLLAAAVVVIGGGILNVVAENVLEPSLTGKALSLSTWLVFGMFFLWVWLLGPMGALLAMPITVLIVLVLKRNERTRWAAELLSREADEPPATT